MDGAVCTASRRVGRILYAASALLELKEAAVQMEAGGYRLFRFVAQAV
jgi:hypothetical protein